MKSNLKYVSQDTDRHGNVRLYFRKGGKKVRLRGPVNSPDFLEDYRQALLGNSPTGKAKSNASPKATKGSVRQLCIDYFQSSDFRKLQLRGQGVRRGILERFCQNNNDGDKPYDRLEPSHLRKRRDAMMDRPEAANNMLKAVRQLFKYAMKYEDYDKNPAAVVEYLAGNPDGFHAWTLEEIAQFEDTHPIGTTARLALALALYTGQRRSDLVLLGRQHMTVHNGSDWLRFTQQKNKRNKPVHMEIPIAPELRVVMDATPMGDMAFLVNGYGRPFTSNGFGNKFRDWCDAAGLPQCSAHGLRKAAAARLAELGCTEQEIMSITGHKTSKEIARYTKSANQKVRAERAIDKMSAKKVGV
ncbi:tyrosine-type recombinase/integrase [Litoreibacter halocynthiae]|uniref:tyrosine-type recombinase/integrase n=1 Tax=Litoreibacter halocynthiae TaxID=1242689 RepID=UPI0024901E6E|nr:site-specific integrase [Litoreibacter halocynthiae]